MPYFTTAYKSTRNEIGSIVKEVTHFADVKIVVVNPKKTLFYVVKFYCNTFRLMYKEPSSG